jgi:hypothetical protein
LSSDGTTGEPGKNFPADGREATVTSPLPAFHGQAVEAAEYLVVEARALRDAADRLIDVIDELIKTQRIGANG